MANQSNAPSSQPTNVIHPGVTPEPNLVGQAGSKANMGLQHMRQHARGCYRHNAGVLCTAKSDEIVTVRTKMANIFATRFMPDLEPETLRRYLHDKLNLEVTCCKIETERSRFVSFQVSAECNNQNVFLNPDLWPDLWPFTRQ